MSGTPRTDEICKAHGGGFAGFMVEHARQLERELTEANAELKKTTKMRDEAYKQAFRIQKEKVLMRDQRDRAMALITLEDDWVQSHEDEMIALVKEIEQENKEQQMTLNDLEQNVIGWAKDRHIIPNATSTAQLLKAVSEIGELADAVNKGQRDEMKDAVGDVIVCLINLCALEGTTLTECLQGAWNEIKDRKGTLLPNGVFVKEEK